jgi:myo-inositol-1(or 4)-monophosphatase
MNKFEIKKIRDMVITIAQEELIPRFANVKHEHKTDGSILTEADLVMQQRIADALLKLWPDTVFLGEEMSAQEQSILLSSPEPVWCLDPLDGTSNFAAGIPYFSVSLALIEAGEVTRALVYDPVRDECFTANKGQGAALNGKPLVLEKSAIKLKHATALIDFKRLDTDLATRLVAEIPYASQRSFGSVALDWCWLAAGRCHIYLHGRSHIWDYAAGNFIFNNAGGFSSTLIGEPVFIKKLERRSSVAAIDKDLFSEWSDWLGIQKSS